MEHVQLTWLSYHFMSRTQYWILLISYAFQSVTKNLSLGTEAFWLGQQRKSGVGVVARYDTKKWVSSVVYSFKLYMFTMSSSIRFLILGIDQSTFRNHSYYFPGLFNYIRRRMLKFESAIFSILNLLSYWQHWYSGC